MKVKPHIGLVLLMLYLTNSEYTALGQATSASLAASKQTIAILTAPKHFENYHAVYQYIAENELIPRGIVNKVTDDCILKIAADSSIELCTLNSQNPKFYYVIHANYYIYFPNMLGAAYNLIHDGFGNGSLYVLIPSSQSLSAKGNTEPAFDLVGIAVGETELWLTTVNDTPRLCAVWEKSSGANMVNNYDWNGKVFALTTTNTKPAVGVKYTNTINVAGIPYNSLRDSLDRGAVVYVCKVVKREPSPESDRIVERGKATLSVVKTLWGQNRQTLVLPYSFPLDGFVASDGPRIWPPFNVGDTLICVVVPGGTDPSAPQYAEVKQAASQVVNMDKDPAGAREIEALCAEYNAQAGN